MARRPTIRSITVATDLQADSRAVMDMAGAISRSAPAAVHLVHVMEDGGKVRGPGGDAVAEQQAADSLRALEKQADALRAAGCNVEATYRAKTGPAHEKILERITTTESDLVIMGSHARQGHGHRLGSTADRVLRTSPVPCLIVRGKVQVPVKRVAALVDFSDPSRKAVRVLLDQVQAFTGEELDVEVHLVHVGDGKLRPQDPNLELFLQGQLDEELAWAKQFDPGVKLLAGRILWGDHPVDAVAEAAAKGGYDLVGAGAHGRGPIVRMLVGSVAMGLCQTAPCPVLVVPPPA